MLRPYSHDPGEIRNFPVMDSCLRGVLFVLLIIVLVVFCMFLVALLQGVCIRC